MACATSGLRSLKGVSVPAQRFLRAGRQRQQPLTGWAFGYRDLWSCIFSARQVLITSLSYFPAMAPGLSPTSHEFILFDTYFSTKNSIVRNIIWYKVKNCTIKFIT